MQCRAIAFAFVACSLARVAHAEPWVELHWRAVPGCIERDVLVRTVHETLARPVFRAHEGVPAAASVVGDVEVDGAGFRATIVMREPNSKSVLAERALSTPAADCARLDDSLVVVVAMMVDGMRERVTPLRVSPTAPRAGLHVTGEIEAGAAIGAGLLPHVSGGAYVRADVMFGRWSLALAGQGWSPSSVGDGAAGARISAWTGELDACGFFVSARVLRIAACIAVGAGFTDATPMGLTGASTTRLPIAFDGVAVDAALHLGGPVWLHIRPALWNSFVAPAYFYTTAGGAQHDLFASSLFVPMMSFGLGGRFG